MIVTLKVILYYCNLLLFGCVSSFYYFMFVNLYKPEDKIILHFTFNKLSYNFKRITLSKKVHDNSSVDNIVVS